MKPKVIHINTNEPIEKWTKENHKVIMETLYDYIFKFVESGNKKMVILKLVFKPKYYSKIAEYEVVNVNFVLFEHEINSTIDTLIFNFELTEEYEKCAELLKLKNEYEKV